MSPCFSQLTQDLCAQYISCLSNRSSSFLLATKNSALLFSEITPRLNFSTCFYNLLISLASRWVLEEPYASNSAPQCPIFSFVFASKVGALHSLDQASVTIFSHSSHKSHFSSNLKLGTPLFCRHPSSLVYNNKVQ